MSAALTATDLGFINRVAARRFAGAEASEADRGALTAALQGAGEGTPLDRAAALAAALLRGRVFTVAPLHTALLAVQAALSLDGFILLAPQGVVVGMIRGLAGDGDAVAFARWLEDRTVPSASGN